MSNLRMQKLLYFAQGFSLNILGRPLLADATFQRWDDGPVEPEVYAVYKHFKGDYAPVRMCKVPPSRWSCDQLDSKTLLDGLSALFIGSADSAMSDRTHLHEPWKNHVRNQVYTEDEIKTAVAADASYREEAISLLLSLCSFEKDRKEHEENAKNCEQDFLDYLIDGWHEEVFFRQNGIRCAVSTIRALKGI